ncbi:MAG: carbohydrate-binding protein [Planctomycetes bacterium]|nr:carbohydrate-binding protein [Planctomycetota bacterium]
MNKLIHKACLSFAAIPLVASMGGSGSVYADGPIYFNQEVPAVEFDSESHPDSESLIRDMGHKVGYIQNGTSIKFDSLNIPDDNIPTAVTVTYSSGGAGGFLKMVYEGFNSNREVGIDLGEFYLPSTGGWENFQTVTYALPDDWEYNYIRHDKPLRLEFNSDFEGYLFDVASFKISNADGGAPFAYNKPIKAQHFSSESHPEDDDLVRNMSYKVGYIKNGTSISFDGFEIPLEGNIPTSITVKYSSGGDGGLLKVSTDSMNSNREPGVTLGEFELPSTGAWDSYQTVTFPIEYDWELNYLRGAPELKLEFINESSDFYLYDILSFEINN